MTIIVTSYKFNQK